MGNALKTEKGQTLQEIERLKKALEVSEAKFASVFEHNPLGMSITRRRDNVIVEINASYTAFTGYTREDIISRKTNEMNIWADPRERERMLKTLKEKGRVHSEEYNLLTRAGEVHPVLLSVEPITYMEEDCLLVTAADIFHSKQAEVALAESEEKFSKAFNVSANATFIMSIADSKFLEINDAFSAFTGYSREETIGHTTGELKLWVKPEEHQEWIAAIRPDGRVVNHEFSSQMKSGEIRIGLASMEMITIGGTPCRLVVITDITERKKFEKALKESEEKFSKTFSSSANAIAVLSIQEGKYVDANESFFRFTGYSRDEIIGHNPAELNLWVYPEEQQKWISALRKDGKVIDQEFSSRMKSGEIRFALGSAEVINISGKPCRILSMTDITRRKKAEEALKNSEENFRNSLDESPLGTRIVEAEGKTIYSNHALLKIYGCRDIDEFNSIPVEKCFTSEGYQTHLKMIQKMARVRPAPGKSREQHCPYRRRNPVS